MANYSSDVQMHILTGCFWFGRLHESGVSALSIPLYLNSAIPLNSVIHINSQSYLWFGDWMSLIGSFQIKGCPLPRSNCYVLLFQWRWVLLDKMKFSCFILYPHLYRFQNDVNLCHLLCWWGLNTHQWRRVI